MEVLEATVTSRRTTGPVELDGRLYLPGKQGPTPGVVVCHPHPAGGGEQGVPLIRMLAAGMRDAGMAALSFDFGGVGRSGGEFTDGREEPRDVAAAVEYLGSVARVGGRPTSVAGWSFGAWMGLVAASGGLKVDAVVAVAPPLVAYDWKGYTGPLAGCTARRYYLVGDADPFCPLETLKEFAEAVSGDDLRNIRVIPGADHFLFGREEEVVGAVIGFLCA